MKEKEYPVTEEEGGLLNCSEPAVSYAAIGSGYPGTIEASNDKVVDVAETWDPSIGPYTMEELNARIDEAEAFIEKAERGDWSDWVTEEQSRANLYSKYPWLR